MRIIIDKKNDGLAEYCNVSVDDVESDGLELLKDVVKVTDKFNKESAKYV